jgi:hypothetical protein
MLLEVVLLLVEVKMTKNDLKTNPVTDTDIIIVDTIIIIVVIVVKRKWMVKSYQNTVTITTADGITVTMIKKDLDLGLDQGLWMTVRRENDYEKRRRKMKLIFLLRKKNRLSCLLYLLQRFV